MRAVFYVALSLFTCLAVANLINGVCPYPLAKPIGGTEDYSSLLIAAQLRFDGASITATLTAPSNPS